MELSLARANFHGPKHVGDIEVRPYFLHGTENFFPIDLFTFFMSALHNLQCLFISCLLVVSIHTKQCNQGILLLKLHTLQLSLKQINKILGQIEGYLFFWPFCSGKKDM